MLQVVFTAEKILTKDTPFTDQETDIIEKQYTESPKGRIIDLAKFILPNPILQQNYKLDYNNYIETKRGGVLRNGVAIGHFLQITYRISLDFNKVVLLTPSSAEVSTLIDKISENLSEAYASSVGKALINPDNISINIEYKHPKELEEGSFLCTKEQILDIPLLSTANSRLLSSLTISVNNIPENYKCFLNHQVMDQPSRDRRFSDQPCIEYLDYKRYIESHGQNPFNREPMSLEHLQLDISLARRISDYIFKMAERNRKTIPLVYLAKEEDTKRELLVTEENDSREGLLQSFNTNLRMYQQIRDLPQEETRAREIIEKSHSKLLAHYEEKELESRLKI